MQDSVPMKLLSPAKINLFLAITGKRADGYHDLCSLMCCVGLYDTVSLTIGGRDLSVACDHPDVPEDETNLAYRAASLFCSTQTITDGVKIHIQKNIPVGAGLGGGSSNAAAVLSGLNRYYGNPLSSEELVEMALAIGADVPFFMFGKPAIATGIGERLEAYPALASFPVLLVNPGFSVPTSAVYKNLNLGLTRCEKKLNDLNFKVQGFDVDRHLCNDLELVTASMYPEIGAIKKALLSQGARGVLMSGSGPTVFGIYADRDQARIAKKSLSQNSKWQFFIADLIV